MGASLFVFDLFDVGDDFLLVGVHRLAMSEGVGVNFHGIVSVPRP